MYYLTDDRRHDPFFIRVTLKSSGAETRSARIDLVHFLSRRNENPSVISGAFEATSLCLSRGITPNEKRGHFMMTQSSVLLDISIFRRPKKEREERP